MATKNSPRSRFLLNNKRITNGKNVWHFDGFIDCGVLTIVRLYGDVTDKAGLSEAVFAMFKQPRYQRAVA